MIEWKDYFRRVLKIDPDSIWLDLCLNSDLATSRCRAFLRGYVEDSVQEVPTLGPEETAKKRTITSANSLLQVWRGLIARADATVLKYKRREDPLKKDTWTLKFIDYSNRQGRGPVFKISRERPDVIPCTPIIRVSFLALLVLARIGSFRPKAILGFKFNQVLLAIVRDQKNRSRTKIAVTFRILIVKTRRSSKGIKAKWITFTVFFVPVPSICLGSFVTSLAIGADAFEPSVDSVETLLQRPNLEGTDYLPLKWKKEVKDTPIFPLDYATFRRI
ncbi:hypothetical protein G7Y89_g5286 [Cudoniella acicularis]|uniref:Uncharacterized protein n=1 Tax=Cudoniella acicularis TaxID=354080 RepID=A0A8H4RPA5_9HELO|nr:hypothetical protein G7Y89_g5286 [Cudoniella acicularis]